MNTSLDVINDNRVMVTRGRRLFGKGEGAALRGRHWPRVFWWSAWFGILSSRRLASALTKGVFVGVLVLLLSPIPRGWASDSATVLYERFRGSIYQIQVIDKGSANKNSIGSGFLLTETGLIATNYHVVSSFIHKPEQYALRVLDQHKGLLDAELVAFDVVHDLAVLRVVGLPAAPVFGFSSERPQKGDRVYALGNPLDLAMTIIEGIHNGPVESARYEQFLFSGSLNSGMSGGPAVDAKGQVMGINVAKGQEQISFLVPVSYLEPLLDEARSQTVIEADAMAYQDRINRDVRNHLTGYYNSLLERDWLLEPLKQYRLPDSIDSTVKCWGHTLPKKKARYDEIHRHCQTQDTIYISRDLSIGAFSYDYSYLAADGLNSLQFYNLLAEDFSVDGFHNATEAHVSAIDCEDAFVSFPPGKWRVTNCIRRYKDFDDLYDAALVAQRVDLSLSSLRINVSMAGINLAQLKQMHRRFLEQVQWAN